MYNVFMQLQYSDNYYRAALIEAIAATVTPAVTTVNVTGSVFHCCLFFFVLYCHVSYFYQAMDGFSVSSICAAHFILVFSFAHLLCL